MIFLQPQHLKNAFLAKKIEKKYLYAHTVACKKYFSVLYFVLRVCY